MIIQRTAWATILSSIIPAMLLGFMLFGPLPGSVIASIAGANGNCQVHAYHFDVEGAEEGVTGRFGPALTATDVPGIRAELQERSTCGADNLYDPALLGSRYVTTANATLQDGTTPANLTKIKVAWADLNSFIEQLATNLDLAKTVGEELDALEDAASASMEGVPARTPTLYMVANDQSASKVTVKRGVTSGEGNNIVFTYANGAVTKFRVECGGQPNFFGIGGPPSDVPECVGEECHPPPPCPPGEAGTYPNCHPPCPPNTTPWPECNNLKWVTETTEESGWDQRGLDDAESNGQLSADQIASGATRLNTVNDQVADNVQTNTGGTTRDTVQSDQGGPVAGGATSGGDNQSGGNVDPGNTNQDNGGINGDTCVPDGVVVLVCP